MFWMGSGVTIAHGVYSLLHPPEALHITWHTWTVLGASFAIDGMVLVVRERARTHNTHKAQARRGRSSMHARAQSVLRGLYASKPPHVSFARYLRGLSDPFVIAVILEVRCRRAAGSPSERAGWRAQDFAAVTGVGLAAAGIGLTNLTGNVVWDGLASVCIGGVLGSVALALVAVNRRFLLGLSVDADVTHTIAQMLCSTQSIEAVYGVHCEWVAPAKFGAWLAPALRELRVRTHCVCAAFRAEIDFDGAFFASRLEAVYGPRFLAARDIVEVSQLMDEYAQDLTGLVEDEVDKVETRIRALYPAAAFIELEPRSKSVFKQLARRPAPRAP